MRKMAIIGGGSWGTALAIALSRSSRSHLLSLWAHSPDVVEMLSTRRVNQVYLPGFELPAEVEVTGNLETALEGAEIVLGVMPSAHARISEVIATELHLPSPSRVSVLTGPSFALEVASGQPTAVVLASADKTLG